MTAPPAPAPRPPRLSEFVQRSDELPADLKQAKALGRDALEVELRRRIIEHGDYIQNLADLLRFAEERFPAWNSRDQRPSPDPQAPYRAGYRSGSYCVKCVWAAFLRDLES